MNKKQYNNVIDWTLTHDQSAQTEDSLKTARTVFKNMGVALPQGDLKQVSDVLKTDDYMGWRSCTMQEAQAAADRGIAAIGVSEEKIIILAANDEEQPVTVTASVMTLSDTAAVSAESDLAFYSYSYGTTDDSPSTTNSFDPFHYSNIEFLRIKKYDMTSYGGDSDITTIVTKSTLSPDKYFEAMAADRTKVAFVINDSLKNQLNEQAILFQNTAVMFTVPFYFYLAKLGVDDMASNGIIVDKSAEYYGIWASETNRLLQEANKVSNQIQLTLAVATLLYSIYNIVSAIKTAKMSMNSTQTYYSAQYKTAVSETDDLFDQLSKNGTKYTKENTMWIVRKADGSICWLETGDMSSGFKHILNRHPVSQFSSFNVSSEVGVSSLIYNTVSTKTPIGTYKSGGLVYSFGNQKYLNIVIGSNGYIVDAYNVSNSISGITFY